MDGGLILEFGRGRLSPLAGTGGCGRACPGYMDIFGFVLRNLFHEIGNDHLQQDRNILFVVLSSQLRRVMSKFMHMEENQYDNTEDIGRKEVGDQFESEAFDTHRSCCV